MKLFEHFTAQNHGCDLYNNHPLSPVDSANFSYCCLYGDSHKGANFSVSWGKHRPVTRVPPFWGTGHRFHSDWPTAMPGSCSAVTAAVSQPSDHPQLCLSFSFTSCKWVQRPTCEILPPLTDRNTKCCVNSPWPQMLLLCCTAISLCVCAGCLSP